MPAGPSDELWLGPPWIIVVLTVGLFTGAMWALAAVSPGAAIGLRWAPLLSIGAVAIYALLIRSISGDPRLWLDPARLERLVRRQHPDWIRRHHDDAALTDRLRGLARKSGAAAIAQQVGLVAGIGAGYAALDRGTILALGLTAMVGTVAGLATGRWLAITDQTL